MVISILATLQNTLGIQVLEDVPLSKYTSARIGGPADILIIVHSADEMTTTVQKLWELNLPFVLIGGGSNILVSDKGIRGITLLNRARLIHFDEEDEIPKIFVESGAMMNDIAQRAANRSFSGLEWAASIPGTVGGAIYGNAGAFGCEISKCILSVNILDRYQGFQRWSPDILEFDYRTSILKRKKTEAVILSAMLKLTNGKMEAIRARMKEHSEWRKKTQPPGASMGSMFKNPPEDNAGRLLEAAGLKGTRIGSAEISQIHANFFINTDQTNAIDMKALLDLAQDTVQKKFGIFLEPEIEIIGDW